MSKKIKSLKAIVKHAAKVAAIKKAAAERNKHGALVTLLDKPDGQYTHTVLCTTPGCGKTRKIKPQDAFQVRFCIECRDAQKKTSLKKFVARQKDPTVKAGAARAKRLARIDEWANETSERVTESFKQLAEFRKRAAAEPKHRRIWPK